MSNKGNRIKSEKGKEVSEELVGRAEVQAGHDVVVGLALVAGKLAAAIRKAEHAQEIVEAKFVNAMLPLHLAVVTRRGNANPLVLNAHVQQSLLKERFVLGFGNQQSVGEFGTVIRLDQANRKRCVADQPLKKVAGAVAGMLLVHFPVSPSAAFVLSDEHVSGYTVRKQCVGTYLTSICTFWLGYSAGV